MICRSHTKQAAEHLLEQARGLLLGSCRLKPSLKRLASRRLGSFEGHCTSCRDVTTDQFIESAFGNSAKIHAISSGKNDLRRLFVDQQRNERLLSPLRLSSTHHHRSGQAPQCHLGKQNPR